MSWHKKYIKINLTTGNISVEKIAESVLINFIGGKGLGSYLLYKYMKPTMDPLSPDSVFIIATGPAQGIMPIAGRYCIVSKSPLSGMFIDNHVGGFLGPELRFAGYDAIVVTGKASEPSIITVLDNDVKIKKATHLWGMNTLDAEDILRQEYDNARVVSIGPAGENLVRIASTTSDYYRTAARGGIGMLFGSKNLKAIVIKGTQKLDIPEGIDVVRNNINSRAKESRKSGHQLPKYGTAWLVPIAAGRDQLPTLNYQRGEWEHIDIIEGKNIDKIFGERIKPKPCYKCTLACSHVIDTNYEWAEGRKIQHPEYESLGLLGSNLGITDLETILRLNHECNKMGLDTISTGSTIAWFMETTEKGVVPEKYKSEGIKFGDGEGAMKLVNKIANKSGVGKILAEGTRIASSIFGNNSDKWAVNVRGLELPAWDPRGKLGLGLSYITSNVGGSHLRGWPSTSDFPDKSAVPIIDSLIEQQDLKILKDSLIMCHFTHSIKPALTNKDTADIFSALTGIKTSEKEMRRKAQRIWILDRHFNIIAWNGEAPRKTDTLPYRLMHDKLPGGIAKGLTSFVSEDDMNKALDIFYEKRNCDKSGVPKTDEINWVLNEL